MLPVAEPEGYGGGFLVLGGAVVQQVLRGGDVSLAGGEADAQDVDRVPGGGVGAVVVGVGVAPGVVGGVDGAADGLGAEGAEDEVAGAGAEVEGEPAPAGGLVLVGEFVPVVEVEADEVAVSVV